MKVQEWVKPITMKWIYAVGLALVATFTANSADAAKCEGHNGRTYAAPIILSEGEDGAKTMLINSTGTQTHTSPAVSTNWQHCIGFWTVNADKSGSGAGSCYSLDADGDQWIQAWEGTNDGGTWAHLSGTGKYAAWTSASKGNWNYGKRYADGTAITTWDGNCGD